VDSPTQPFPAPSADDGELLDAYSSAVTAAAEAVAPTVVHIDVNSSQAGRERRGSGSGFFFTGRTAAHQQPRAQYVRIRVVTWRTSGSRRYRRRRSEFRSAVIRISTKNAPHARSTVVKLKMGRSRLHRQSLGFDHTVTAGVVSALG
jgi:S1-C subfamily serine protease